jgi:hypothetical protein
VPSRRREIELERERRKLELGFFDFFFKCEDLGLIGNSGFIAKFFNSNERKRKY